MSTSIPGRGKQRKNNYGQDLSSNNMPTGGGPMAMPPNMQPNAQYVLPSVPMPAYSLQFNPPGSGHTNPSMIVPDGVRMQSGVPQGVGNTGNQNSNWNGPPQQQQQHMQQHDGMVPSHNGPRGVPQPRQFMPQQQMAYTAYPPQPTGYMPAYAQYYPNQDTAYQAAMYAQHQHQQQYAQQYQMMSQQQQPHQMQQQSQSGGPPMTMPAPAPMQPGGGAAGGAAPMGGAQPMQHQSQQQQPMHGGGPPASAAPPVYSGPAHVPMTTGPMPSYNNHSMPQQQGQPRPAAPVIAKKKNIIAIVNPDTHETVNQNALEASNKEEDAPKAEKEEVKGTDETDSAAPEVKKQFATQILEQTTKSDQPAPVPAPAAPVKHEKKILFSLDQMKEIGVTDKVAHVAAPPVVAAAPAVEKPKASEYLPEPMPASAYPNNYKEKQTTPEITLPEVTASNNDEQLDDSHLTAEVPATPTNDEPASSSSEKNTSNDSAICVQTPVTPPPPTESATVVDVEEEKTVVVEEEKREEEEEKQEEEVEETPSPVEPLSKKLEQLVIPESASQEEAESEPSTPAPVTPSVSETAATLAEEEEDAEKLEAARLEELQRKKEELEAEIALNENDLDQVDITICRYNREYLYNVRDYEKLFNVTTCPLTPVELITFGICRSLVNNEPKRKQDGQGGFMPGWARGTQGSGRGGGGDRKPYAGRQSEQNHRGGGGGGRHGSNKKLPPSIRPSIERRVETNVQLHKAEKAWKPEKVTETDESEEAKKKLLLKTIRSLFNKITPTTKDALINEFLVHKVYESPCLNDVISIIFDKAVEEPKFCPLYSAMCIQQVTVELGTNKENVSNFRNAILFRAQETFSTKNLDEYVAEKKAEIEAETDDKKKKEKQIELLEHQSKFRRRKFGNITFIGQLYLQGLLSIRIIHFCIVDLLKSVTKPPDGPIPTIDDADEESVDCAVRLLETIGRKLQEESSRAANDAKAAAAAAAAPKGGKGSIARHPAPKGPPQTPFPLEMTFSTLEAAMPIVSSRIKFMIMNLVELRKTGWVPRKTADAGPKKLDEIKKDMQKEQMENQNAQMAYERKHSRQDGHGMGGGRGPMGGRHGENPKRMVIQRNSQDSRGTKDERMSQAHKSATLATRGVAMKKASLSSVTNDGSSLGGSKKKQWSGGASGGSENSKKEDRAAAIQSARGLMGTGQRSSSSASMKGAEDEGASASGTATQVNSEDEREQNELREKQEKEVTKRLVMDIGDYHAGEITFEECREEVFKVVGAEKFQKPSHAIVFKCLMAAAVKKAASAGNEDERSGVLAKFGHVLSFCLLKLAEEKDKAREEILKGVAEACRDVVEQEQWEDDSRIWTFYAEVLINAHLPTEGLFEGAHPSLGDFKDAFLNAAKDTRKPYTLFVLVLKRLAEMHYKRDKDGYMEIVSWVLDEDCNKAIMKQMDTEKLDNALKETKMEFAENLHKIMRGH